MNRLVILLSLALSACGTVTADPSPDAGGDVGGAVGSATGGSAGPASGGSTGTGGLNGTGGAECIYTLCGSPPGCYDTAYDANNCGSCGHVCGFGKLCVGATCVNGPGTGGTIGTGGASATGGASGTGGFNPCVTEQTLCAGQCVGTLSNRNNCGGCGNVCAAGTSCVNGACTP